jgi:hypothetical protein
MVSFEIFLLYGIVFILFNFDVSQLCSETKSMASDSAINGKNLHNSLHYFENCLKNS